MASHRAALLALLVALAGGSFSAGAAEWRAIHGVSAERYQQWIDEIAKAGMRLDYVQGYDAGPAGPQFAAVAVRDAGRAIPWQTRHGLDGRAFQAALDEFARDGYRLSCLSGYRDGDEVRFAGLWLQEDIGRWQARTGLEPRAYQTYFDQQVRAGLIPLQVVGYATPDAHHLAAIFLTRPVDAWVARHDLTAAQYQRHFDDQVRQGLRPLCVSGYGTAAGVRFAVVLVKDGAPFIARHNLTGAAYQQEFDAAAAAGFRLSCLSGYRDGNEVRYAAVWSKEPPAATRPAVDHPLSGTAPPHLAALDEVMLRYLRERSIPAGSLAVSRRGKLVLSRGYGWKDEARTQPLAADASFRIASLVKAMTAACIHKLAREGKFQLDDPAFALLPHKPPPGQTADPRVAKITVRHLLDHRAGFNRDVGGDPMFNPVQIAADLKVPAPATADQVITWMLGRPLDFDPGTATHYSNFGYCVLGRIIEQVSGKTYVNYLRDEVLSPIGANSVRLGRSLWKDRASDEPWYSDPSKSRNVFVAARVEFVPFPYGGFHLEAMDAHGGLIASAPDLTKFLEHYWIDGLPRRPGEARSLGFFGSLPGTHTLNFQRPDGVVVAVLFNQRADGSGREYGVIRRQLEEALNRVAWPD